ITDDDVLSKVHILIDSQKCGCAVLITAFRQKHLQHNLNEFIFKFNRLWILTPFSTNCSFVVLLLIHLPTLT
ncbi:MAG: hypothetical protein WCU00_09655, partial [Candidatus Latescibacterota bacterium]